MCLFSFSGYSQDFTPKGKPNLGLWYPRESSFDLEAFSNSDYAGANLDRKSTTGGCQFLGSRLISWQCKKQTIVATSTTEAEYVATASCCGQVLWIQYQMLDYGFNFMNTKIHIDNESTICIMKNPQYIIPRQSTIEKSDTLLYEFLYVRAHYGVEKFTQTSIFKSGRPILILAPTHTHEAETGHMSVDDLFQLVPQLMTRIESLEKDLKQTKQTMGNAIVKLVKNSLTILEKLSKSREWFLLDSEDEAAKISAETLAEALSQIKTKRRNVKTGVRRRLDAEDVSTGFEDVSTGFTDIKSASEKVSSGGEHVSASQREGKAVLEETPQNKKKENNIIEEQASEELKNKFVYLMMKHGKVVVLWILKKESRKETGVIPEERSESAKVWHLRRCLKPLYKGRVDEPSSAEEFLMGSIHKDCSADLQR
ncbi:hypothetical protein Tco_0553178 [Tanacetum coccineum]